MRLVTSATVPVPAGTTAGGTARARRRGVTLVEGILYLALSFSVITFSAQTLVQERTRQEATLVAGELRQHIGSTQAYVSRNYSDVLGNLFDATAAAGDELGGEIPMNDLRTQGFLPSALVPGAGALAQVHGQEFAILARAVRRNDANIPKATATRATVINAAGDGIDDRFTDGDPGNDELDLEVLLISRRAPGVAVGPVNGPGGRIADHIGNRIVASAAVPSAGFIRERDPANPGSFDAAGPYGGWVLDVNEFSDVNGANLLDRSGPGHFGAMIALSNFGVLRSDPDQIVAEFVQDESLSRCAGVPVGSAAHTACIGGSGLYQSIVFNTWNSGTDDVPVWVRPGLEGVGGIAMAGGAGAPARISGLDRLETGAAGLALAGPDGAPAAVSGVNSLALAAAAPPGGAAPVPATISGVDTLTMGPQGRIDQLFGISCLAGGAQALMANGVTIDCPATRITGTLVVDGAASVGGGLTVTVPPVAPGSTPVPALNVSGDTRLAGALSGTDAGFTGSLAAGSLTATAASVTDSLTAGKAAIDGRLTVAGTEADRVFVMDQATYPLDGNGNATVSFPGCGKGYTPEILWAPVEYAAKSYATTGTVLDRDRVRQDDNGKLYGKDDVLIGADTKNGAGSGQSSILGVRSTASTDANGWRIEVRLDVRKWFDDKSAVTSDAPGSGRVLVQTLCVRDA